MSRFEGQGSMDYDAYIKKLIPSYQLLQQLTATYLKTRLKPNDAKISLLATINAKLKKEAFLLIADLMLPNHLKYFAFTKVLISCNQLCITDD